MFEPLGTNAIYSRSGTLFSRSLLIEKTLSWARKAFFVFETEKEAQEALQVLPLFFEKISIRYIKTVNELLASFEKDEGFFLACIGIFEKTLRIDYKRTICSKTFSRGSHFVLSSLIEDIVHLGYIHSKHLSHTFTYKVEWDTITIRSDDSTFLLSFFGDELDDIRIEGTLHMLESITIFGPTSEKIGELSSVDNTVGEFIGKTPVFLFDLDFVPQKEDIRQSLSTWIAFENNGKSVDLWIEPCGIGNIENFESLLRDKKNEIHIFTRAKKTLDQFLEYNNLSVEYIRAIPKTPLESFERAATNTFFIADDILSPLFIKRRTKRKSKATLDLMLSLAPGDYVVHFEHGIGKFVEVVHKEMAGIEREYLTLEYAGWDKLHVPITELYRLTKYLSEDEPKLHRLGGDGWKKTLEKTEDDVIKTATELLEMYANRKIAHWYAFPAFREKESIFKRTFPYEHTADQTSCIEEIFVDMESSEPMDRLLSGDVGFWKTEVAMNAAYKAVLWGKQVAVISPLVVLALEHYDSFIKRFSGLSINIQVISRMSSPEDVRTVLRGLHDGTIDIVIWTHRLLQEDIHFKRLWFLIIDEEHKFWVLDKERITKMKAHLDILSLSATPIPRSLNMALSGVKKISTLWTPPKGKKSIHTIVSKWNPDFIKSAITTELDRGGQVIFLHNRIASLAWIQKELNEILHRKLKTITIHGQMDGDALEKAIFDFKNRKYDILLSTTVIENGVNFLSANTIFIDNADEFWLAQLHQLRGRVGRKDVQANCILLYRKEHLAEDAKKRLLAIVENSRLGAGFEIAMRDLEIRWAGEILGIKQSGRAKETGISLYLKLLEEKVEELRSWVKRSHIETKIELDIPFVLPDTLFASEADKMHFYRSLESMDNIEDLESAEESFTESIDEINPNIHALFLLLRARVLLAKYLVTTVKKVLNDYVFDFSKENSTENLRAFLDIFDDGECVVQTLYRSRIPRKNFTSDLDFLQKLIYSLVKAWNE